MTFHIEHIIPKSHGGDDNPANLCLACDQCNTFKGTNLAGIDPSTGELERLYDPRSQAWRIHFELQGGVILGLTGIGRTTAAVLKFNTTLRVQLRSDLLSRGVF